VPSEFVVGSRVAVECDFRLGGVLADPNVVLCRVLSPNAVLTTYTFPDSLEMAKDAPGVYRCEFTAGVVGPWGVRFEGSGVVEAVAESAINVLPSRVL